MFLLSLYVHFFLTPFTCLRGKQYPIFIIPFKKFYHIYISKKKSLNPYSALFCFVCFFSMCMSTKIHPCCIGNSFIFKLFYNINVYHTTIYQNLSVFLWNDIWHFQSLCCCELWCRSSLMSVSGPHVQIFTLHMYLGRHLLAIVYANVCIYETYNFINYFHNTEDIVSFSNTWYCQTYFCCVFQKMILHCDPIYIVEIFHDIDQLHLFIGQKCCVYEILIPDSSPFFLFF